MQTVQELLSFIARSPSCFHAAENLKRDLLAAGYTELSETERWSLRRGGKYFVMRNGSSILAFRIPEGQAHGFLMAAAHSDSPTFKVKENAEKTSAGCVQLDTEKYGGGILSTWFDRPLSVAGRLLVREDGKLVTKLVNVDKDLLIIPSVAIHMNRAVNDGWKILPNIDTLPLYAQEGAAGFMDTVAAAAGVEKDAILGSDLFLYVRQAGTVLGAAGEFVTAPKLDDLECAWSLMRGFLNSEGSGSIPVCCVFDNEEVGSETRQGAASNLLRDTLRRIALALGEDEEGYLRLLAGSFLVSADNAHAQHPNHPEYADSLNCPHMNGGIVLKFNANQRYATDAVSGALLREVCAAAQVPVQVFANRSDLAGGSTLGSIASTKVPVPTADIGLAQLAMHSCYETAGVQDLDSLIAMAKTLFSGTLTVENGAYRFE